MAHTPKKLKHGHIDDDALAFAIFSADGKMLLHDGDNGQDIPYRYRREGFDNGYLKDDNDLWRFFVVELGGRQVSYRRRSGVGLPRRYGAGDRSGAINAVADRPSLHAADFYCSCFTASSDR